MAITYGKQATSESERAQNRANLASAVSTIKSAPSGTSAGDFAGTGKYAGSITKALSGGGGTQLGKVDRNLLTEQEKFNLDNPQAAKPVSPIAQKGVQPEGIVSPYAPTVQQPLQQPLGQVAGASQIGQQTQQPQANDLTSRYRGAFTSATASGKAAPLTPDRGAVDRFIPEVIPPKQPDNVDMFMQEDPQMGQIMKTWQEYMAPQNQRKSLTDEYKKLTKQSGIQELNTELINMKNVIEGTEDDIRNEITKAGGFATDSQVMAMTNSRNKQLIKNYNTLLETRNSQQEYINTMMSLESKDRAEADSRFDRNMNFGMQMLSYRDKMQQNAVNSYNKVLDRVGYKGLYDMTGGDPYYLNTIEKTLGLGSGGLQQLSLLDKGPEKNTQVVQLDNGKTILIDSETGETIKDFGGMKSDSDNGLAPEIIKENAQDYQFAKQAYDSAVNTIKSATGKTDISTLTKQDMAKLSDSQALIVSKALSITANPKSTRATGGEDALGPSGWGAKLFNPIAQTFRGGKKYSSTALLEGIKAIDSNFKSIEKNLTDPSNVAGSIPAPDGSGDQIIIVEEEE